MKLKTYFRENQRRKFLKTTVTLNALSIVGLNLLPGCNKEKEDDDGQKESPAKDLMQEHSLLN